MGEVWKHTKRIARLVNPRSIAIIGASDKTMYGRGILEALLQNGYRGKLYPVNPKRDNILGIKCFKKLSLIGEPIDLAIIIVGRNLVLGVLEECVENQVQGALVITAGFSEADEEGKKLEEKMKKLSEEKAFPIWGPNCAGFANFGDGVVATLLREEGRQSIPGSIGFVSQSGALMMSLVGVARDKGLKLRYAVSTGNESSLSTSDFMTYMLHDSNIRAIVVFVEGFKDPERFIKGADLALEKGKPLYVLKVGRSQLGEKAAASHTGSMTGSDVAYETLFNQKGIIRAVDTEELWELAKAGYLSKWPSNNGIAIITSSGGAGSLCADLCSDYGLDLPELSDSTRHALLELDELLTFGNISNPVDVRGQGIRALEKVLPIVCHDERYGAIVVVICFSAVGRVANDVAGKIKEAILKTGSTKPVFVLWIGRRSRLTDNHIIEQGYEILESSDIPVFKDPQRCLKAIKKAYDYSQARKKYSELRELLREPGSLAAREEVKRIVTMHERRVLSESESKRILSLYRIPVTKEKVGHSGEECANIANEIGFPVALKVMSPDLLHKTDAGAIELNVSGPSGVKEAFDRLMEKVRAFNKQIPIEGVLVQEMVSGGVEIILGMKRDRQLGPLILFGLGGIFVEIYRDVAYRFPPISSQEAQEMIRKIRGYKLLKGARGKGPYDLAALEKAIMRFSSLCTDRPDKFEEIDINPLIVREVGQGVVAVDALFVL